MNRYNFYPIIILLAPGLYFSQVVVCFPRPQEQLQQAEGRKVMASATRLPIVTVSGSYYDVGVAVGKHFAERIDQFYKTYEQREKLNNFSKTAEGEEFVRAFKETVERRVPHLMEELKGLAKGSGQSADEMFLFHLAEEIALYLKDQSMMIQSCSDIMVNTDLHVLNGHNEDNTPSTFNTSYIVHATITSPGSANVLEDITAFCYAGKLCGSSFAFNGDGLVFTTNAISGREVQTTNALPRDFIGRAVLGLDSVASGLHILQGNKHSPAQWITGASFSLNIGSRHSMDMVNVELSPSGVSIANISNGFYHHFNMFQHLPRQQFLDLSSIHRQTRFMAMIGPSSDASVLRILGDTADNEYPIFRSGAPPDGAVTVATALFDLSAGVMEVYLDNPKTAEPVYTISIPKGHGL